jgi:thiamine biosynthesis lipoprotein
MISIFSRSNEWPSGQRRFSIACLSSVFVALLVVGCAKPQQQIRFTGATMGTQYAITVVDDTNIVTETRLKHDIEALLAKINQIMSNYDSNSEISRLNRHRSTDWLAISDELLELLTAANSVSQESNGAFDVTVAPLVDLWGFGPARGAGRIPDNDVIEVARRRVGLRQFELRASPPGLKKLHGEVAFDLSGIAKGYAVDEIAHQLRELGLVNFLVDIGGEMRAVGTNQRGEGWQIGIEGPIALGSTVAQTITLHDSGLASSGNYRNNFVVDGVQYGHTIDPKTGLPTQHALLAVSVVHARAMLADAWATALMSMGPDAAVNVLAKVGLAAMLFKKNGDSWQITTTPAFDEAVKQR